LRTTAINAQDLINSTNEYINSLSENDRNSLLSFVQLGVDKCKQLLRFAIRSGKESNIDFAQAALLVAILVEKTKEDHGADR
jgi:hypothetical protein